MKIKLNNAMDVEQAIQRLANLTAGKLSYGLARNMMKLKDVLLPARDQCKTENEQVKKYLNIRGQKISEAELLLSEMSEESLAELERIDKIWKELLETEVEIDWHKIKLADVPGMRDGDDSEKGIIPVAFFAVLLDAGIIDDSSE
jgi:hypothetical protein